MKTTAAALRELQDYFASIDPKPNIREIAKAAKMPYATAARYLNGTTQQGIPSRVRALALALGREDIMAEVTAETPTKNADAWWIVEIQREWRENNEEELERERSLRVDSEKRYAAEIERIITSKDKSIDLLRSRIAQLEKDKENQSLVNKNLLADKAQINTEMLYCRRAKRKYEVLCVVMLIAAVIYISVFDLPNPSNGLTLLFSKLFG